MGFIEAWGSDPNDQSIRRPAADEHEPLDFIYSNTDAEGAQIPSAGSEQVEELWRMFGLWEDVLPTLCGLEGGSSTACAKLTYTRFAGGRVS